MKITEEFLISIGATPQPDGRWLIETDRWRLFLERVAPSNGHSSLTWSLWGYPVETFADLVDAIHDGGEECGKREMRIEFKKLMGIKLDEDEEE